MAGGELARVDERSIVVSAAVPVVWRSVAEVAERAFSAGWVGPVARALGCRDTAASGPRPLATGSTFPGFRVAADEPRELALLGGHRFSEYALIFRLDDRADGTTRLRAETRADFPGLRGSLYRAAVIGTRGHALVVHRLLRAAARHAERT
ncbi:hypothetical protein [Saccharopolyspora griseoalba]|uniref:DUF2867 domain-containing protein n=1 Tax=Saccharopolyspora griseoalba TaxID=1431848 RepID=A0ABW2LST1_9PSEU